MVEHLLFHIINLQLDLESLERLENIANDKSLGKHVKCLDYHGGGVNPGAVGKGMGYWND